MVNQFPMELSHQGVHMYKEHLLHIHGHFKVAIAHLYQTSLTFISQLSRMRQLKFNDQADLFITEYRNLVTLMSLLCFIYIHYCMNYI